MKRFLLLVLLLPAALLGLLLCGAVMVFTLSVAPPLVSAVALVILGLLALWFFARRRGSGPVSESSLIGYQSSKEGLL